MGCSSSMAAKKSKVPETTGFDVEALVDASVGVRLGKFGVEASLEAEAF